MLVDFYATLCSRSHARSPGVFQALTHCENEEEGIQPCIDQLGSYLVRIAREGLALGGGGALSWGEEASCCAFVLLLWELRPIQGVGGQWGGLFHEAERGWMRFGGWRVMRWQGDRPTPSSPAVCAGCCGDAADARDLMPEPRHV